MSQKLTIGFIPLVDAASLLAAADFGFAEEEGLAIELVREVSWANIREKLNAGVFDAAHMLAPMAIASALKLSPGSVPLAVPYVLALNGNAITVSEELYGAIATHVHAEEATPLATARALAAVIAERKRRGLAPLSFGITFPFSCHMYQLTFWMAAGGVDVMEDVRLIVLPPPYMVESMKSAEVDGFCVGAPWNSLAVEAGIGHILHFGCEIIAHLTEKTLAVRADWAAANGETMARLMRALSRAAHFASSPENWELLCRRLARQDRIDIAPDLILRALGGALKISPGGQSRDDGRYLRLGFGPMARPNPIHAAWFFGQMVRWRQVAPDRRLYRAAQRMFSAELFDAVFGEQAESTANEHLPADGLGAFHGPSFSAQELEARLAGAPKP